MKRPITQKQLAANRRNAQRSTGPRSPEGKARVRFNALKHGLLARALIVPARDGPENRKQFERLLAELHDELQPVGILENILVEKIAVAYWRLRRSLRVEAGEITRLLDLDRKFGSDSLPGTRSLPSRDDTLKIVRYENSLERQLHRAINQLARLQDRRLRPLGGPAWREKLKLPNKPISQVSPHPHPAPIPSGHLSPWKGEGPGMRFTSTAPDEAPIPSGHPSPWKGEGPGVRFI